MITHTPAPWHVIKRDNRDLGSVHYAIETVEKLPEHPWSTRLICWMSGMLGDVLHNRKPEDARDDPAIEADAYLLAAAPEIYEALKEFVSAAQSWHDFHAHAEGIQCDRLCACIEPGRAALAKAEVR